MTEREMEFSCSFCWSREEEVPLIELSSNLLYIDKVHYDFPHVFEELFNVVSYADRDLFVYITNFIASDV